MTIQIGNYKVKIQAEDKILTDMPKAEATKYFLNELSVLLDRAADHIRDQEDLEPETRQRVEYAYRRDASEIFQQLVKKGFYADEKQLV